MSKKKKIAITHTEDFSEIEHELSDAMNGLDEANQRIEAMLSEHARTEADPTGENETSAEEGNKTGGETSEENTSG